MSTLPYSTAAQKWNISEIDVLSDNNIRYKYENINLSKSHELMQSYYIVRILFRYLF